MTHVPAPGHPPHPTAPTDPSQASGPAYPSQPVAPTDPSLLAKPTVSGAVATGTVVVHREANAFSDRLRKYKVLIDEEVVGKVGSGKTLRVEVPAGDHHIRCAIDWTGSPHMLIPVYPGQETHVHCRPGVKPIQAIFKLAESTGDNTNWIDIRLG